jgi:hypothetical protein
MLDWDEVDYSIEVFTYNRDRFIIYIDNDYRYQYKITIRLLQSIGE